MIRALINVVMTAAAAAAGVALGRQHERTRPFGTAYWRAEAELALHLYDEDRLARIQPVTAVRRSGWSRTRYVDSVVDVIAKYGVAAAIPRPKSQK